MRLEYRSNNANDTIILVDSSNVVRSRWDATTQSVSDFADCVVDADDWDDHYGDEHSPDEFGSLVATREGFNLNVHDLSTWHRAVGFVQVQRRHAKTRA